MSNNFNCNFDTRRAQELYLPLQTLAISQKDAIYIDIKLYNKLPKYIKDTRSSFSHREMLVELLVPNCYYNVHVYHNFRTVSSMCHKFWSTSY